MTEVAVRMITSISDPLVTILDGIASQSTYTGGYTITADNLSILVSEADMKQWGIEVGDFVVQWPSGLTTFRKEESLLRDFVYQQGRTWTTELTPLFGELKADQLGVSMGIREVDSWKEILKYTQEVEIQIVKPKGNMSQFLGLENLWGTIHEILNEDPEKMYAEFADQGVLIFYRANLRVYTADSRSRFAQYKDGKFCVGCFARGHDEFIEMLSKFIEENPKIRPLDSIEPYIVEE